MTLALELPHLSSGRKQAMALFPLSHALKLTMPLFPLSRVRERAGVRASPCNVRSHREGVTYQEGIHLETEICRCRPSQIEIPLSSGNLETVVRRESRHE